MITILILFAFISLESQSIVHAIARPCNHDNICNNGENCVGCPFDCKCPASPSKPTVALTYYWVLFEDTDASSSTFTTIGKCDMTQLASVKSDYAPAVRLEGSGY